ncbi:response regulator [Shumkonia mesophila]|uniref:response regulator n=1 Tax=Shumkonia mesophila TaxID=2838854 RepID=UPI0029344C7D|nr:response regulator [Shumkonia mesophila]
MEGTHRSPRARTSVPGSNLALGRPGPSLGAAGEAHPRNDIVRHIPYLRRYARALAGSQEAGDRYVRICLEALVEEPESLRPGLFRRLQLYHLFHQTWTRIAEPIFPSDLPPDPTAGEPLDPLHGLSSRRRQVLLLTAVEGFSLDEAAAIMEMSPEEAEIELTAARIELNDQAATSVLIIEDEPIIAFDLSDIVSEMGHDVIGTAATKDEAVALAMRRRPGIILADIQLGDGSSGIDAVAEIHRTRDVPVVFVTAYPERLLTGARREPAYLVTKPFEPDVLRVTIYQALLSQRKPPIPGTVC